MRYIDRDFIDSFRDYIKMNVDDIFRNKLVIETVDLHNGQFKIGLKLKGEDEYFSQTVVDLNNSRIKQE